MIIFKEDHNGDVIASSLALAELLKKIGRQAEIVCPNFEVPNTYQFLTGTEKIRPIAEDMRKMMISLKLDEGHKPEVAHHIDSQHLHIHIDGGNTKLTKDNIVINENVFRHDLILVLNTPDLESLGDLYHLNTDFFYSVPLINIDHSPENEHYGHINYINITATSIAEILYDFIEQIDANLLTEEIATYLLTGMVEKTKSFKLPTVTPKSLNIASQLVAAGAERESIIQNLYQRQTVNALKLWGKILLSLQTDNLQKIAWAEITQADFEGSKAIESDLPGVIEELIVSIPSVELSAIFYQTNEIKKCLIKSEKDLNLRQVFQDYHPTGNKTFITIDAPETKTIIDLLQSISH